jgi:hypothetical protein
VSRGTLIALMKNNRTTREEAIAEDYPRQANNAFLLDTNELTTPTREARVGRRACVDPLTGVTYNEIVNHRGSRARKSRASGGRGSLITTHQSAITGSQNVRNTN